jgi:hypothetical protein
VKIYYPNALDSTLKSLPVDFKNSRVVSVAYLDQGGINNPLTVLKARYSSEPNQLKKRLNIIFG